MSKNIFKTFLVFCLLLSCKQKSENLTPGNSIVDIPKLTLTQANRLASLPLQCMQEEYPNKLGQTLNDSTHIGSPKTLHPTFYGCFDWHSSVHGHWSLVSLLKKFPNLNQKEEIRTKLLQNISKVNVEKEVAYFRMKGNSSYERTYGWAWFLKLVEELHTWNDPLARTLEENLQPLTAIIVEGYLTFLPKLNYPIRVGEHANTAFGLTFAYDYAVALKNDELKSLISERAKDFYLNDVDCPITWEPSGFDFLSPCLEEADIMRRILPKTEFKNWLIKFLPELSKQNFTMDTGKVSDRTDGKLVHLDGVNFSRAWCLMGIAETLPSYSHLKNVAYEHIAYSLPTIVDGNYSGTHWLGSFALNSLNSID